MLLNPKESGKFIASLSKHVKINQKGVAKLGDVLLEEAKSGTLTSGFKDALVHPKNSEGVADWIFVVDTLNFCFWSYENTTKWTVNGQSGYFALCEAINRAQKENIDIVNPKFYSTITKEKLGHILRSDNEKTVPLLEERVTSLHEVGAVLLEKFDGTFETCIKEAKGSAKTLLQIIVDNFKCFKDEAVYQDKAVSIYKRAQILVGDVWACYENKDLGYFKDINELTMFADYRVPQTLLWFGVLEYSEELMKRLNNNELLTNGEEQEVEIRGCSIHAVELLRDYVKERLGDDKYNSIVIDYFLWNFRRKHADKIVNKKLPFHKTYSIYY